MNALDVQSGVKHHQSNLNALAVNFKKSCFHETKENQLRMNF